MKRSDRIVHMQRVLEHNERVVAEKRAKDERINVECREIFTILQSADLCAAAREFGKVRS